MRNDFPILDSGLIYFDNACMPLRPKQVVDKINEYYLKYPACAGRSHHTLAKKLGEEVDKARDYMVKFLGAKKSSELIYTKNCTESLNLVANSFKFNKGDKVVITDHEHNSNLVPWLLQKERRGISLEVCHSEENEEFSLETFQDQVKGAKLISMVHTSNMNGYTIPASEIIKIAHENDALVMLDGAQSVSHSEINVKKMDVDFLACSGHKFMGPSGIGMLYGKEELLNDMNPFLVGGETVKDTTYDSYTMDALPHKFEAGLQHYAGIIGMSEAARYLDKIGRNWVHDHEIKLNTRITTHYEDNDKVSIIGPKEASKRGGIFSFNIKGMDPHNVSLMLNSSKNIAMRSGAHCVHSWFNKHKLQGSVRASFYLYNTKEEVDLLIEELDKIIKYF